MSKLDETVTEVKAVVSETNDVIEASVATAALEAAKAVCEKVKAALGVVEPEVEPKVEEVVEPSEPEAEVTE